VWVPGLQGGCVKQVEIAITLAVSRPDGLYLVVVETRDGCLHRTHTVFLAAG
jgi:hypothetical protein